MSAFPHLESSNLITWERVFLPLVMIDVVCGVAVEGWMSECGTVGMLEQNENLLMFSWCCAFRCVFFSWASGFGVQVSARANINCWNILQALPLFDVWSLSTSFYTGSQIFFTLLGCAGIAP